VQPLLALEKYVKQAPTKKQTQKLMAENLCSGEQSNE